MVNRKVFLSVFSHKNLTKTQKQGCFFYTSSWIAEKLWEKFVEILSEWRVPFKMEATKWLHSLLKWGSSPPIT